METLGTEKKKITAILRSFNNPAVAEQTDRLLEAGVGHVVIIINAARDDRKTLDYLGRDRLNDPRVSVHEMDEYGWSRGINRGLFLADHHKTILKPESGAEMEYILNVSNEARIQPRHIEDMLGKLTENKNVGMVGTTFSGVKEGEGGALTEVNLGPTYNRFPRNTCALYRFDALKETWGFDPAPESYHGMEDYMLALQLRTYTDWQWRMEDLKVPLIVGRNFDQVQKEKEERDTLAWIENLLRERAARDPELARHFEQALREMHAGEIPHEPMETRKPL